MNCIIVEKVWCETLEDPKVAGYLQMDWVQCVIVWRENAKWRQHGESLGEKSKVNLIRSTSSKPTIGCRLIWVGFGVGSHNHNATKSKVVVLIYIAFCITCQLSSVDISHMLHLKPFFNLIFKPIHNSHSTTSFASKPPQYI